MKRQINSKNSRFLQISTVFVANLKITLKIEFEPESNTLQRRFCPQNQTKRAGAAAPAL
ncbi:hypothetical protein [uncultured Mobiluncus sp.]|uniref:hypothetical protein n=1 Tax=uncultured Mobiluncus sp. TaxID=293425 RepID=UPI00262D0756|nr:hypothetical protein [uncultured Mobiluncus sp.]